MLDSQCLLRSEQIVTIGIPASLIATVRLFARQKTRRHPGFRRRSFPFLAFGHLRNSATFALTRGRAVFSSETSIFNRSAARVFFTYVRLLLVERTVQSQRPILIANRPPQVSLSSPLFPALFLARAARPGRGTMPGKKQREQEGKRRNPTSWPKLFSEIRRFFRASSEMIFARINPYGRHGNRSAWLVHPRRPKSAKPAGPTNGRMDSGVRCWWPMVRGNPRSAKGGHCLPDIYLPSPTIFPFFCQFNERKSIHSPSMYVCICRSSRGPGSSFLPLTYTPIPSDQTR